MVLEDYQDARQLREACRADSLTSNTCSDTTTQRQNGSKITSAVCTTTFFSSHFANLTLPRPTSADLTPRTGFKVRVGRPKILEARDRVIRQFPLPLISVTPITRVNEPKR